MSVAWLGVLIAFAGAIAYALGAAIQQMDAVELGATSALMRRPRWWLGGGLSFAGASLHAVALSMASLTIIQPISMTTLVYAVPLAALLHRKRPRRREVIGSAAVSLGLAGLMLMLPVVHTQPHLGDTPAALFLVGVLSFVAITQLIGRRFHGPKRATFFALGAGVSTGTVSLFVRLVGAGVHNDLTQLLDWFTLVVPVMLVVATVLLQRSYAVGCFGVAYSVGQTSDPIASVVVGALLLGEPLLADPILALPAVACGVLMVSGTVVLGLAAPQANQSKPVVKPEPQPATVGSR